MPTVLRFETSDFEAAHATLRQVYPTARLQDPDGVFRFSLQTRGEGELTVSRFRFSSRLDIHVELRGVAAFGVWNSGSYRPQINGTPMDPHLPVGFIPGSVATSQSTDLDQTVVNIPLDHLRRHAGLLHGEPLPPVTDPTSAPDPVLARFWRRTVDFAEQALADDEVLQADLARATMLEQVVRATIIAFPRIAAAGLATGAGHRTIRRAQRYIEDNAHRPIDVTDVAHAAGTSTRGLHQVFRRDLDTTPRRYLERVRLDAVHQDLVTAGDDATVAAIARRWGFVHLGRFAALYRRTFGENPSRTLGRDSS